MPSSASKPQAVDRRVAADLTAGGFVAALEAFEGYDPRRGAHLVWLYGIDRQAPPAVSSHGPAYGGPQS
ncbi:hypothetical protein ACFY9F_10085 [Streptomyces sp. NPDC012421]|uniref:hypothetical protein n=1 Tax=Streptomyces sp. NPDC012421 TaxID=3364832 RepID=UPI0036E580C2